MYRDPKHYAARAAAIKEALEQKEREEVLRSLPQPQPVTPPASVAALRDCGKKVLVTLGVFFHERQGEVVEAVLCYYVWKNMFLAKYTDEDGKVHIIECFDYNRRDDIYNYAISEKAVL